MTRITLPQEHRAIFDVISEEAARLDRDAYVVGGYVRDLLLGVPSKDIDVVCIGPGIELARAVGRRFDAPVTVYESFGTAALVANGVELEFVGARKESYERGSRNPVVEDGTLLDDLTRRDFTINALAVALHPEDYADGAGQLLDLFRGVEHMRDMVLVTPQDPRKTFEDDPLRILRAVRFQCRLGFTLRDHVAQAAVEKVPRLDILTQERITDELRKMIRHESAPAAFAVLSQMGILSKVLPELEALNKVEEVAGQSHKDNFAHSLVVLEHAIALGADEWERWAALLHDIGKAPTKLLVPGKGWTFRNHEDVGARMIGKIFTRLKLPLGEDLRRVQKIVALHGRPKVLVDQVTDSAVRRIMFEAGEDIDSLMLLVRSDFSTVKPDRIARHYRHCDTVDEKVKALEAKDSMRAFRPALMGDELMQVFELKPGRIVGAIKRAMENAILDGDVPNEHDALVAWVTSYIAESFLGSQD
jgi:poly(A) polymerase